MKHTRVGTALFDWPLYVAMSPVERCLWFGLYVSAEAKRVLPGLFHGGVAIMAEAARLPAHDTHLALGELEERGVVVFDRATRLLRFTSLPDRGDRPANGRVLKSWWGRYVDLPDCNVKREWVGLLRWLVAPFTDDHQRVWDDTFATIPHLVPDQGVTTPDQRTFQEVLDFAAGPETVSDTVSDTTTTEDRREKREERREGGAGGETDRKRADTRVNGEATELAQYLLGAIKSHTPDFDAGDERLGGWAKWIQRSLNKGRPPEQVRAAIDFAHRNDADMFWRANLLSGRKLHEKFETLRIQASTQRRRGFRTGVGSDDFDRVIADLEAQGL